MAPFREGAARWDGVRESVSDTQMGSTLFGAGAYVYIGTLRALALRVRMVDEAGQALFEGIGGIQLLDTLVGYQESGRPRAVVVPVAQR